MIQLNPFATQLLTLSRCFQMQDAKKENKHKTSCDRLVLNRFGIGSKKNKKNDNKKNKKKNQNYNSNSSNKTNR